MKKSKILSILMAVMLVMGIMPLTASAAYYERYDYLYVNGIEMYGAENNTVVCGDGTAVWNPDSMTLTLTNATIEHEILRHHSCIYYATESNITDRVLTIKLVGNNTITTDNNGSGYGIYSIHNKSYNITAAKFKITGDGDSSLTINAEDSCILSQSGIDVDGVTLNLNSEYGIGLNADSPASGYEGGAVSINKADITVNARDGGINSWSDVTITDSKVNLTAQSGTAQDPMNVLFCSEGTVTVSNSTLRAEATKDFSYPTIWTHNMVVENGSDVTAISTGSNAIWMPNDPNNNLKITPAQNKLTDVMVGNDISGGDSAAQHFEQDNNSSPYSEEIVINNNNTDFFYYKYIHIKNHIHTGGTATCKDKAVCDVCGLAYGEFDADNHVGGTELRNQKDETCTEDGYTGDIYCLGCESVITAGEDISAAGHTLDKIDAKEPTHDADGNMEYYKCSVCGKLFKDAEATEEITVLEDTVIAKGEHNYGTDWKSDETSHWHECECGDKTEPTAHSFKWITDKEATASEKGSKHEECEICGYKKAAVEIPVTETAEQSKPTSPQTSDSSSASLFVLFLLVSAAGLLSALCYNEKKKYNN